jgi:hypothetical protein
MIESNREPLIWRSDVHRAIAWLKAPSEDEDHASFQLDVVWFDAVERLPEVFALERSNPNFEVAWNLLHTALTFPLNVFVAMPAPNHASGREGDCPQRDGRDSLWSREA